MPMQDPTACLTELAFVTWVPCENQLLGPCLMWRQCTWELPVPFVVSMLPLVILYHFVLISFMRITHEVTSKDE